MSSDTLRDELSTDPLARGYSTMTDDEVAADLHTAYRTREKDRISGSDVWDHTDPTEFGGLSAEEQRRWLGLCGVDGIDPFDSPAVGLATSLFPAGGATLTALGAFRTETLTRAGELGLGDVHAYDVAKAREQLGVA